MDETIKIHPSAVIDERVQIGPETRIWHFTHVMSEAVIGARCNLGQNVFVGRGVRIGDGCKIQNNVSLYEGVVLEEDVFCGPSMVFTNVRNPRSAIPRRDQFEQTHVERGATLGANCTIVCGVRIGHHALVGAGAVVTHDVAPYALILGAPARRVGWVGSRGVRLIALESDPGILRCPESGELFEEINERLEPVDPARAQALGVERDDGET